MGTDTQLFLEHYGVKGMRWGVRRREEASLNPKSSKETVTKAKAHAKAALKPSVDARLDRLFGKTTLKYSDLSTKQETIKRGQELYRTTKRKDELLKDMTYTSYLAEDRNRYRTVLANPRGLRYAKASYSPTYEAVYKATKTLKSPSEKERFDAFVELLDAKEISVGLIRKKNITGKEYLKRTQAISSRDIRKLESRAIGEKAYYHFVANQFMNTPLNSAYFNKVRDRGYNALVDDNDRGIVADRPLMILDTKTSIKQLSVRQLTNDEINAAASSLTPMKTEA